MSPRRHSVWRPVNEQAEDELRVVADDDALLDALARRDDVTLSARDQDRVATLLHALTVDVDTHAERAVARPAVAPSVSLLPAGERRRRPTRVRRSTAAVGLVGAIVAGSTGVAAAVTGDPFAGLTGLQRVIEAATGAEAPGEMRHAPEPGVPADPDAPGAVPGAPGALSGSTGSIPGSIPGSTVPFAPARPDGTGSRKPETPGAALPTTAAREAAPSSPDPAGESSGAETSRAYDKSKPTREPGAGSPSRPPKSPEPTDSPSPKERDDHGGGERAPTPDPGRPGVASSSLPGSVPGEVVTMTPAPPAEGD